MSRLQAPSLFRRGLSKRRQAEQLGRQAEQEVARLLEQRGFVILAMRLKTLCGELDVVAATADCLVFVEVKARTSVAAAGYGVSARQQQRLWRAAELVLAQHPQWARPAMRFDAAWVVPGGIEFVQDIIRLG